VEQIKLKEEVKTGNLKCFMQSPASKYFIDIRGSDFRIWIAAVAGG
jgi:hypothetical protein